MSDVLARIRVKETHGIRRFLYPLTTYMKLPATIDREAVGLIDNTDNPVPLQLTSAENGNYRVDFAVSIGPMSDMELRLINRSQPLLITDPLHLTHTVDGELRSTQEKFAITLSGQGRIEAVVYDEEPHLQRPARVWRGDHDDSRYKKSLRLLHETETPLGNSCTTTGGGPLAAWVKTVGQYRDGANAEITTEITACKSWVTLNFRLGNPQPKEAICLQAPLVLNSSRPTYDTGLGGGVYGRLKPHHVDLLWTRVAAGESPLLWEIHSQTSRQDWAIIYQGNTLTQAEFQAEAWLHIIDQTKALAVAFTQLPEALTSLQVTMGDWVVVVATVDGTSDAPIEFGVCYHFLNDVPAIAAATNPQSILLPPTVEVLPG